MSNRIWQIILAVSLIIVVVSGVNVFRLSREYQKGINEYEKLEQDVSLEEKQTADKQQDQSAQEEEQESKIPVSVDVKYDELKSINEDFVGWLYYEPLEISYPIVRGNDNDYYTEYTFENEKNSSGAIFMDFLNRKDYSDFNTIIYGHNMRNGTMFGSLKKLLNGQEIIEENPYFYIYNALLSRSTIFEFKSVSAKDIAKAIQRAISILEKENNITIETEKGLVEYVSSASGGDVRKAINTIELLYEISPHYDNKYHFSLAIAEEIAQKSSMKYDRDGDAHYDLLSAFQKSIRGSDPNASVFYLAKLLSSGDIISPSRRLLVIAAEDIGLAHPNAIAITKACVDTAFQLGLPEARIPLAEATIFLATCPKSNSAICAIDSALDAVKAGKGIQVPAHLQDAHYAGASSLGHGKEYLYPHDYPSHYVDQQYLPDDIKNKVFNTYSDNKIEKEAENYWSKLKKY